MDVAAVLPPAGGGVWVNDFLDFLWCVVADVVVVWEGSVAMVVPHHPSFQAQKKSPEVLAVVAVALGAVGAVGAVGTARVVVAVDALLIQVATVDKVSGQGAFPAAPPAAAGSRGDWLLWP